MIKILTKIPHKCTRCNCQLYLEDRYYFKGKYYCKKHLFEKYNKKKVIE